METNRVILHIQIPFCDFRRISPDEADYLPLPNWNSPIEDKNFIKYFGTMEKRKKSAPQVFIDENFYVRGRGGIKFVKLEKSNIKGVKCLYKKLWNDKLAGTKYELGLEFYGLGKRNPVIETGNKYNLEDVVEEVLANIKVNIKHLGKISDNNYSIIDCPKPLIQLYDKATSSKAKEADKINIKYGNLCLFFEKDNLNQICKNIEYDNKIVLDQGIDLFIKRFKFQGREVAIFVHEGDFQSESLKLRQYRVMIMRMYFEYQNLRLLLNHLQNPNNKIDHNVFDRYLNKKIKYFKKYRSGDDSKDNVLLSVQSIFEIIAPGEIENLSTYFINIRPQIKKNLLKLVDPVYNEIRREIGKNNIGRVFEILFEYHESNTVILLQTRLNELNKNVVEDTISYDDLTLERNKLNSNILSHVNSIYNDR